MIGRLLKRLFGSRGAGREAPPARPLSPPAPAVPVAAAAMPPPPPPPPAPTVTEAPAAPPELATAAPDVVQAVASMPEPAAPPLQAPEPLAGAGPVSGATAPAEEGAEEAVGVDFSVPAEGGRVKLILGDGTLATPALDDELAERLRYIVDNIVAPPERPST